MQEQSDMNFAISFVIRLVRPQTGTFTCSFDNIYDYGYS